MVKPLSTPSRYPQREITSDEGLELWLGPSHHGSHFASREDLRLAWVANRDQVMADHGQIGRRPLAWWQFEAGDLKYPGYDLERSVLYEASLLGESECAELEAEWREQFLKAHQPGFWLHTGKQILNGTKARRAHYQWADIAPSFLLKLMAERRRELEKRRSWPKKAKEAAEEAIEETIEPSSPTPEN
jgi:hypothetical protein